MPGFDIIPYQESWPAEFEGLARRIREALGGRALRVDHIGSTSVPGLASKDKIDVQITVADFSEGTVAGLIAALEEVGYTWIATNLSDHRPPGHTGPDSDWEKRYFRCPVGERRSNTHVRAAGRANQRYALLFRDYLRARPQAAAGYAELKRRLAAYVGEDTLSYTEIKDPVCDVIMAAAEDWARATGWSQG
jgi:GrpB-like predicted nucleotidyltransferase (UPF0157 family)